MERRVFVGLVGILSAFIAGPSAWAVPIAYAIEESTQNLVTMDLSNGNVTVIGATGGDDIDGLALSSAGVLYGSDNNTQELVELNRTTGAIQSRVGLDPEISDSGLAFNDGILYMSEDSFESADSLEGQNLHTVNVSTGELTLVGSSLGDITAIAFDSAGTLFGLESGADNLVTFDLGTGALSVVGALGFNFEDEQGMTYDPLGGLLYAIDEASHTLHSILPSTGAATLIADLEGVDYEALAFFENTVEEPPAQVPEPSSLALLGIGLLGLGFVKRRDKKG